MRVRPLVALSAVAVTLLALAGCASSGSSGSSAAPTTEPAAQLCDGQAPSGAASDAVQVSGAVGEDPTVSFSAPLTISDMEAKLVVTGTGETVSDGDYVDVAYAAYDPATGAVTSPYTKSTEPSPIVARSVLGAAFGCAPVGSRAVITTPAASSATPQVYVIDLLSATPADQWCVPTAPTEGETFPTVAWGSDGSPTITVPSSDMPPSVVTEQVLTPGDGDTVQTGDSVTVNYTGAKWSDGTVFDSSWTRGSAATFPTTGVVAGFGNALVGQQVGAKVLVVIPPACGYGTAATSNGLGGETLVFAISIESTARS